MENGILDGISYRTGIIKLLAAEKLPVSDLPRTLENFKVVFTGNKVIGVAGIEIYDAYALLRSVAVQPESRGKGIADQLLISIEDLAKAKNMKAIYLLTETAADYFSRKGYQKIARDVVPVAVQAASEFSHVCPAAAIVMMKNL